MNKQNILGHQVNVYQDVLKKAEFRENTLKKQLAEIASRRMRSSVGVTHWMPKPKDIVEA